MFGKKKGGLFNSVDDTRSLVNDFRLRLPYESYRTTEYRQYPKLHEDVVIPELDMYLERLLSGQVDDGNCDLLDNIIFSKAREAIPDLARQHVDHADMLRRLVVRRKADYQDFSRVTEDRKRELTALEAAYAKTCDMLAKVEEG